jgi:8-oxo-dGTP pyrophosphatase MutT (NUDIX family)
MAMSARDSRFPILRSPVQPPLTRVFRPAQLRKMKGSEQVAAVCYRIRKTGVEFLLVRTRGGRWIFPKGSIESGLTNAQAAALEAYEEAGVHGRMEEDSFAGYVHRKDGAKRSQADTTEFIVQAYLCEVLRLAPPKESYRRPKWFSVEKTKRGLRRDRNPECAAELTRIVDLAVRRIRRLTDGGGGDKALARVCVEGLDYRTPQFAVIASIEPRLQHHAPQNLPAELKPEWSFSSTGQPAGQLAGEKEPRAPQRSLAERGTAGLAQVPPALLRIPRLTSGAAPIFGEEQEEQKVQVIEITDTGRGRFTRKKRKNRQG